MKPKQSVNTFSVTFDDIAEGRIRKFINGALNEEFHFDTYGQALHHIEQLREKGWQPLTMTAEAIEVLLQTAEKYHRKVTGNS